MVRFERSLDLPVSAGEAYAWHARPGAFERLTPPWEDVRILRRSGTVAAGQVELALRIGGLPFRWVAEHYDGMPGERFRDRQLSGPFAAWDHEHRFEAQGEHSCRLHDVIDYQPPLGLLGRLFAGGAIAGMLGRMFRYRHEITRADLEQHACWAEKPRLTVGITGASGLIGSALAAFLSTGGHRPVQIARTGSKELGFCPAVRWSRESGQIELGEQRLDAVVHLAGENIAGRRWTAAVKREIAASRIESTRKLCEGLARLTQPPKTLICASAIGIYGDRGDEELDESSPGADGFLAQVCRDWEAAAQPARDAGMRVVNARLGVVLSSKGGALAAMLPPFRFGGGGIVGNGKQFWSWIALDDVLGAITHLLHAEAVSGPVNLTAPQPQTNYAFTQTLGKVLFRPTFAPLPAFMARIVLGPMADELLLASAKVRPQRLLESGYTFRYEDLESALRHTLGR